MFENHLNVFIIVSVYVLVDYFGSKIVETFFLDTCPPRHVPHSGQLRWLQCGTCPRGHVLFWLQCDNENAVKTNRMYKIENILKKNVK